MPSAVPISALAPHAEEPANDLPAHRPQLRVVDTDSDLTPAPHSHPEPAAESTPGTLADLAALVAELVELETDRCLAVETPRTTEWLAEIASQRAALRARARILCTQLGLHRAAGCSSCCPAPSWAGAR
jgi:hypothetical protein